MQLPLSIDALRRRTSTALAAAPYLRKWLILGALIGVVAGLGAVIFINALDLATRVLLGYIGGYTPPSPLNEGHNLAAGHFTRWWAIPLVVGVGGLVSGIIVDRFAPEAAGHGTDAAIAAVHRNPKGVRPITSLVKIVASAITIGSGGSGGREGPTAQISSGFASFLSRALNLSPRDARIAVTIGIGSGIGSIFRTPLGGAVLGAEILYREDLETGAIVPGFVASIVGFVVFGLFQGFAPIFGYHAGLRFSHPVALLYYAIIGLVAAPVGLLYDKSFWAFHRWFRRSTIPAWAAPAVGGLVVGLLALAFPQVLGTGYGWVQRMMTSAALLSIPLWLVVLLPVARIVATSLSIGSGGSGGIFGPGMVIGALVGAGVWRVLELFAPGVPISPAPFVIVGMMACFGSIGHIPIATMLMVAEMTGNLSLLAPAMVAVGLATLLVGDNHIYIAQLKSRADSPAHRFRFGLAPVGALPVTSAVARPEITLTPREPAAGALVKLQGAGLEQAVVVDEHGVLAGVALLDRLEGQDAASVAEVATLPQPLVPSDATLDTAIETLALAGASWAPVVDGDGYLTGVTTTQRLLNQYTRLLRSSVRRLQAVIGRDMLLEEGIGDESSLPGTAVAQVEWPPDTLVLSVQRGGETLFATDDTVLRPGDRLTIVTRSAHIAVLAELLGHAIGQHETALTADPLV